MKDFEAKYGSRPYYYGPLDRDARKVEPLNLIYVTKEPIFVHMYRPVDADGSEGQTLWFGLEPQLTDEEENIRRTLIEVLLQDAPSAPSFTTDDEFENILSGMIDRYTVLDTESRASARRQGRVWEVLGMEDKRITVTTEQRDRLRYTIIRDLIRNGPLEPLLSLSLIHI